MPLPREGTTNFFSQHPQKPHFGGQSLFPERWTVILNGAAGGVKDLRYDNVDGMCPQILRCAQNDKMTTFHPERSEGSGVSDKADKWDHQ